MYQRIHRNLSALAGFLAGLIGVPAILFLLVYMMGGIECVYYTNETVELSDGTKVEIRYEVYSKQF